MSANLEMVIDFTHGTEESLGLYKRFEFPHLAFTHSGDLMRVFSTVVLPFIRDMACQWEMYFAWCAIAGQFVGDDFSR